MGIDRLQSYASLHKKNKEKTSFIRILSALLILSFVFNIVLFIWGVHMHDTLIWSQYLQHLQEVDA